MTTPAPQPGPLYDEVLGYPAGLSIMLAALQIRLTASPSPEVARRTGYYIRQRLTGQFEAGCMFETAYRRPAWNREHAGPVAAECGWTDYVDAAAIRAVAQGEGT
jgi:hypothetical protein